MHLGGLHLKSPEHANAQDEKAFAYVRPHDLQVERYRAGDEAGEGIVVRLERAVVVGPIARLELVPAGAANPADNAGVAALIEAQKAHKVDLVEYGPLSFYIAEHTGVGVENVGIMANSATDDGSYHSIGWANASQTGVNSLADFKGKKTCFVDPASTSGYLFPTYGLMQVHLNPQTDVKPVFAGAHDASLESIAKGTCEVGFSEDVIAPQLEEQGKVKASDVRQVWQSPLIPGSPIAVSTSLPADLRAQLENVLDTYGNADQLTKLGICSDAASCKKTMGIWGFKPPSVADYSVIDKVCAETKSTSCTNPDA